MCIRSWTKGKTPAPPPSQRADWELNSLQPTTSSKICLEAERRCHCTVRAQRKGSLFFYLFSPIILEAKANGNCPLIFHFDRNSVWHLRQQTKKEFHLHFSVIFCPPRARISFGFSSGSGLSVASSAPNTPLMKWPGALLTRLKKMPTGSSSIN